MSKSVHPAVAVVLIIIVLGIVWALYTQVLTGQQAGHVGGPPSSPKGAATAPAKR